MKMFDTSIFENLVRFAALSLCCSISFAETTSPKEPSAAALKAETCFIKFAAAPVYCGPKKDFYITGQLQRGDVVEVYYRTNDGWCAIRPPQGSHSWLAAERAYLLPGGKVAEVVGAATPAWIGSENREAKEKFRWQIELQPTQQVDVIGETRQAVDSDKVRLWYKILPPPGEFRWIRSEAIGATPPNIKPEEVAIDTSEAVTTESVIQQAVAQQIVSRAERIVGPVESGPSVGEYIEGEGVVVESGPAPWTNDEAYALNDGEVIVGDEGMIVESSDGIPAGACPNCNNSGCTTCDASHQTDGIDYWDSMNAPQELPPIRYRPLARILGLFGLSVVEGESVVDPNCTSAPGCQCGNCMNHPSGLLPRESGRFGHLPRPARRYSNSSRHDFMSGAKSLLQSNGYESSLSQETNRFDRRDRLDSADATSLAGRDWHGTASARDMSTTEDFDRDDYDWSIRSPRQSPITPVSSSSETLKFSTPEIQSAMNELTRLVAEPMAAWEFRSLAMDAQRWIDQAADPIARGEARLLLERIEEFETLRRRSQGAPQNAVATAPTGSLNMTPTPPIERISVPAQSIGFQRPADDGRSSTSPTSSTNSFNDSGAVQRNSDGTLASDASGWLVEVFSAQPGQPEFALTDDHGGLIAYVQPAPGMNLRRYVKQPVGIYGVKGYLPHLSSRQIVAERIVRLR